MPRRKGIGAGLYVFNDTVVGAVLPQGQTACVDQPRCRSGASYPNANAEPSWNWEYNPIGGSVSPKSRLEDYVDLQVCRYSKTTYVV